MRVVVFVPARQAGRWEQVCRGDVERRRDEVVALAVGADQWPAAVVMHRRGDVDQVVVARWAHVPYRALPYVRVIGDHRSG